MNLLMLLLLPIFLLYFVHGQGAAYTDDRFYSLLDQMGTSDHNDEVTQSLNYCRISKRDLIAAAESTALRVLKGVCNPRELNDQFKNLEKQIVDQFNILKTMMINIENKIRDQDDKIKDQHRKLHRIILGGSNIRNSKLLKANKSKMKINKSNQVTEPTSSSSSSYDYFDDKDIELGEDPESEVPSPRVPEIKQFNSTIAYEDGGRVFNYYWTIRDMTYRMKKWGWKRSLRSSSFYIFPYGYRMYMRIYPNQNGRNVYIHVGITKGQYDDVLDWPFKIKHRIQVIDHEDSVGEDLRSRIWDPTELCSGWNWRQPDSAIDNYECVGLGFSHETLESRKYLYQDSITVKISVYLDSI